MLVKKESSYAVVRAIKIFQFSMGLQIIWQYLVRCNIHPCRFRAFLTVDELTLIPCLASFFWACPLVVPSFVRICLSKKAFTPAKSFDSRPERFKFAMEPVNFSLLIIRVTLAKPASQLPKYFGWMKILLVKKLDSSSRIIRKYYIIILPVFEMLLPVALY